MNVASIPSASAAAAARDESMSVWRERAAGPGCHSRCPVASFIGHVARAVADVP
jgi:hypothetical protein